MNKNRRFKKKNRGDIRSTSVFKKFGIFLQGVENLPEEEGFYKFLGENKKVIAIKGVMNLKETPAEVFFYT
jgi:hypothetical protein